MNPYYDEDGITIYHADSRDVASICKDRFGACVTSPPYMGLRDYGSKTFDEKTPSSFARDIATVLIDVPMESHGYVFCNLGDTWAAGGHGGGGRLAKKRSAWRGSVERKGWRAPPPGYKKNDQTLFPFLCADEIRKGGLYLRQTVVWSKPVATEPVRRDRPPLSHEYVFVFRACERAERSGSAENSTVWTIAPDRSLDHPATMPIELASRCIAYAGGNGPVIDPFMGSGTTLVAAKNLNRKAIGIEIEEKYCEIAAKRLQQGVFDFGGAA